MKRGLYTKPFRYPGVVYWDCPFCVNGTLSVIKDTFHYNETVKSKSRHHLEDFTPFDIDYVYSCLLRCLKCGNVFSNAGTGYISMEYECDENGYHPDYSKKEFSPKYFHPNLKIFKLPEGIDKEVEKEINKSFSLFFCDPSSSANHVRIALENLLTYLEIDEIGGSKSAMSLHNRIQKLSGNNEKYKEGLLAIKIIGNTGSHNGGEVYKNDVLDSYEIINSLLIEIFDKKSEKINKIITEIKNTKRPRNIR